MKIKELMTKKVITAKKSDPISKIAKLMANFDIGMVVIINDWEW
jgi:predicted transcriptional regulator